MVHTNGMGTGGDQELHSFSGSQCTVNILCWGWLPYAVIVCYATGELLGLMTRRCIRVTLSYVFFSLPPQEL